MVQDPLAATGVPVEQVVPEEERAKELALAPLIAILLMVSAAPPVLFSVTGSAALVVFSN